MRRYKIIIALMLLCFTGSALIFVGAVLRHYGDRLDEISNTGNSDIAIPGLKELDSVKFGLIRDNERINYNLGVMYFKQEEYSRSIASFQKVIDSSADSELRAKAYYNIGVVFLELFARSRETAVLELAVDKFQKALAENPHEEDARYNLEKIFQEGGLAQQANKDDSNPGDEYGEGTPEDDF